MELQGLQKTYLEWKDMLIFLKSRRRAYLFALLVDCTIMGALPVAISFALNELITASVSGSLEQLIRSAILISLTFLLFSAVVPIIHYSLQRIIKKTMADIRVTLYEHLTKLPVSYFEANHPGEMVSRIINDAHNMEEAYGESMRNILQNVMTLVMVTITMLIMDWRFSLIFIVLGVGITFVNVRFVQPLRETNDRLQAKLGEITAKIAGFIEGLPIIKTFSAGKVVREDLAVTNKELTQTANSQGFKTGLLDAINYLFSFVMFGGMLVVGLFIYSKNELGILGQLVQLQTTMVFIFLEFGRIIASLQHSLSGSARVYGLLNQPVEEIDLVITDKTTQKQLDYVKNSSSIEAFSLQDVVLQRGMDQVLNHVTLSVRVGELAAVVGTSGSGKSTLLKALLGFYPPAKGDIYFFAKNAKTHTLTQVRELIAYVPQDPYLFEGTIEENIRFGRPDAEEGELIEAAKAAFAHEFILELPDGYKTRIGEDNVRLSGGQRQRIAIARALVSKAPIVLFDEPTSALDSHSETCVRDAIRSLKDQRTVMIVTHQMQTAEIADVIFVMEQGSIVDHGSPNEMKAKEGPYLRLFAGETSSNKAISIH
ncbi:ABC transporter ATP-binding protein [Brevibacillus laterosporus]|uniref:ABC transporter ATP-binding protein n=1 Tax=Brevibacillus laterosporus TaxID=1465 RepID=UPI0018F88487|nr:ABC transporter ATP-binding protein [Brevibacillus laterosporus]MBG9773141.1 ABC transporter ATP-binding protein [Brevibacillus laterosporus]